MDRKEAIEIVRKNYPHVGISDSEFESALRELVPELKESEDERTRKDLIAFICQFAPEHLKTEYVAYLEKQKEQKSFWIGVNCSINNIVFPFTARVKSSGKVVTIHDGQLSIDAKRWIKFQSNESDGYRIYEPGELLVEQKEQKPAEWSKEDESNLQSCIAKIEIDMQHWDKHGKTMVDGDIKLIDWLKSLRPRPHWKPSEEQIGALERAIVKTHTVDDIGILAELRDNLKKL